MKRRILCLFLGCLMILSSLVFVGCDNDEDEGADIAQDTGAKTITLRLISQKKVCNNEEELAAYLKVECGGKKDSEKYKAMKATMDAYNAVEEEIAKITKSDYKTDLEILFYTEADYIRMLEDSMSDYALQKKEAEVAQRALEYYIEEYKQAMGNEIPDAAIIKSFYDVFSDYKKYESMISVGNSNNSSSSEVEMETDQYGIEHIVYPEAEDNQIDIIYISGYDMYTRYVENEWITPLNSYINTTGKQLLSDIAPTLMNGVKIGGETYAIPNNVQIGEYTYMLVDRDMANKYQYYYENFENIVDCENFVKDVAKDHKDILPIDASFKDCMDLFVWYWNIEVGQNGYSVNKDNDFSIVGKFFSDPSKVGRGEIDLGFNSLLADEEYRNTMLCLKGYELDGCFRAENDTRKDPAISFKTGTYAMYRNAFYNEDGTEKSVNSADYGIYTDENGKEYMLYVAKYPRADEEALYGNMFAVSANTVNAQASVEIITLLNTNPKVRNLLQYGIMRGEHEDGQTPNYYIDEETGMLVRLNDLYMMDIEKTGNCFIAYPEEGKPSNYWEDAKAQNNDALIDPLSGFDFNARLAEYGVSLDNRLIEYCGKLSQEVLGELNKSTYEEIKASLDALAVKYSEGKITYIDNTVLNEKGEPTEVTVRLDKMTDKKYDISTSLGEDAEGKPIIDAEGESPYAIYYKWLEALNYLPAE